MTRVDWHFWLLVVTLVPLSWLGMMAVHELGHAVAAWVSGGQVQRVILHPFTISRTDVWPNPRPLIVVWGGPLVGMALPLGVWLATRQFGLGSAFLWRWFAGFCWLANGAYLTFGSWDGVGDVGDLLRLGCPVWVPVRVGLAAMLVGLGLWHRLGASFGVRGNESRIRPRHVWATAVGLASLLAAELVLSPR